MIRNKSKERCEKPLYRKLQNIAWNFINEIYFVFVDWETQYCSQTFPRDFPVQWLRICLPMQGTRVWALVWGDPTCCGATKPVHHNYWACALEPASHNYWARVPQLLKPTCLEPMLHKRTTTMRNPQSTTKSSPHSLQLEKARAQQRRTKAAKTN